MARSMTEMRQVSQTAHPLLNNDRPHLVLPTLPGHCYFEGKEGIKKTWVETTGRRKSFLILLPTADLTENTQIYENSSVFSLVSRAV
jgi:hypothetical protein